MQHSKMTPRIEQKLCRLSKIKKLYVRYLILYQNLKKILTSLSDNRI